MAKPSKTMGSKKPKKRDKEEKDDNKKYITTPKFRLSWPSLTKANKNGKFEITMLFPKNADLSEMRAIHKEALIDKFGRKAIENKTIKVNKAFRKGEEKADLEGYEGSIFAKAVTNFQPGTVKKTKKGVETVDVEDVREEFQPGYWCVAKVNAFPYDVDGNRGAQFGLKSIMVVAKDEVFGGGAPDASEDFNDYEGDDDDDLEDDEFFDDEYDEDEDERPSKKKSKSKSKPKKKSRSDDDDDLDDEEDDDSDDEDDDEEDDRRPSKKSKKKSKPKKKSRRDDDEDEDDFDEDDDD